MGDSESLSPAGGDPRAVSTSVCLNDPSSVEKGFRQILEPGAPANHGRLKA